MTFYFASLLHTHALVVEIPVHTNLFGWVNVLQYFMALLDSRLAHARILVWVLCHILDSTLYIVKVKYKTLANNDYFMIGITCW